MTSSRVPSGLMASDISNASKLQLSPLATLTAFSVFAGNSVIRSDILTMVNHLRRCPRQPSDVTKWANQTHATKYARPSRSSASLVPLVVSQPPFLHPSSSHQPLGDMSTLPLHQLPPSPFYPQPTFSPQLSPLQVNNPNLFMAIDSPIPSPQQGETNALGFLMPGSPAISPNPPSRPLSSLASFPLGPASSRSQSRLSPGFDQHNFNMHIGRMTVAASLPVGWTDNPETRSVFRTFFPWVQLPSRKTLSRTILPTLQNNLRVQAQKETKGSNCTLQCDGWTAINMHHLIAFMITVWPKVCMDMDLDTFASHQLIRSTVFECMMHMVKRRMQKTCWSCYSL